jgi:hypothetical protein
LLAAVLVASVLSAGWPAWQPGSPAEPAAGAAAALAAGSAAVVVPQYLGNPSTDKPIFSRNVWDMQAFGSRIYLGHGDWDDNTGPIPIRYFDTGSQQLFTDPIINAANTDCPTSGGTSYCVDDEEIDNYRIIDGKLFITGVDAHDAVDQWSYGNFYTRGVADSAWTKYRTIPAALHVFDLAKFPDPLAPTSPPRLFAAIGPNLTTSPLLSDDDGRTSSSWSSSTFNSGPGQTRRVHRLFTLAGRLYGSGAAGAGHYLLRYEGGVDFSQVPYSAANRLFPDRLDAAGNASTTLRVFREVYVGPQMAYLGLTSDMTIPFGLYKATDVTQALAIALPVAGVTPMDLIRAYDGQVYALGQTGAAGSYTNYVFASADLMSWTEVLRFAAPTFARSVEYLDGDFYFGLGTTRAELSSAAGSILRARNPLLPPLPTPTATSTPPPTSTRTATPTGTATTVPPPRVAVSVAATSAGRLAATIAARPAACAPTNLLQELRFGDDPRVYRNAAVEIDGAVRQPPFAVTLPAGTVSKSFVVLQLVAGADAIIPVTARDACGEWQTFVGGGAGAFQSAGATSSQSAASPAAAVASPTASPGPSRTMPPVFSRTPATAAR